MAGSSHCSECSRFLSKDGICRRCTRTREQVDRIEIVPNEPLRARFLEAYPREDGFITRACDHMADRGFRHYRRNANGKQGTQDTTYLKRRLGVMAFRCGRTKKQYWIKYIPYEEAVELCRALDMAPVDAGV